MKIIGSGISLPGSEFQFLYLIFKIRKIIKKKLLFEVCCEKEMTWVGNVVSSVWIHSMKWFITDSSVVVVIGYILESYFLEKIYQFIFPPTVKTAHITCFLLPENKTKQTLANCIPGINFPSSGLLQCWI